MPKVDADRDTSKWFCLGHGGHPSEIAKSGCRPRLGKADGNIRTLHLSPLEVREMVDSITQRSRNNRNSGSHRDSEHGKENTPGLSLEVAKRHASGPA